MNYDALMNTWLSGAGLPALYCRRGVAFDTLCHKTRKVTKLNGYKRIDSRTTDYSKNVLLFTAKFYAYRCRQNRIIVTLNCDVLGTINMLLFNIKVGSRNLV